MAARSAMILGHISLQLASFSVGEGFVNSTIPPLPPPPPFVPDRNDVIINMLWFLSLTLSILASFFTIAVQQWLRAYLLPSHLSTRDSLRLWSGRSSLLYWCQVPAIITFLPIILQIAVVLFLLGVYFLLRGLSHPITTAFAIVTGVPFLLYALSLPLPVLFPASPYKSPLIPAMAKLLTFCKLVVLSAFYMTVFGSYLLLYRLAVAVAEVTGDEHRMMVRLKERLDGVYEFLGPSAQTIGQAFQLMFYDIGDFWVQREIRKLIRRNDDRLSQVDMDALYDAAYIVPHADLWQLQGCVSEYRHAEPTTTFVLKWIAIWLGSSSWSAFLVKWSPIDLVLLSRVDRGLALQFEDLLVNALPEDWTMVPPANLWETESYPAALMVLARMDSVLGYEQPGFHYRVMHILFAAWTSVQLTNPLYDCNWMYIPVLCLLQCSQNDIPVWTEQGT